MNVDTLGEKLHVLSLHSAQELNVNVQVEKNLSSCAPNKE